MNEKTEEDKKFYKDLEKQSDIFEKLNNSFQFYTLTDFIKSMRLYIFHNFSGIHEFNKINLYHKNILELICLYIIELSNEWEKFIQHIFEMCEIKIEKKSKENSYGKVYYPKLLNEFKYFKNSMLNNSVNVIKSIANKLKHSTKSKESILEEKKDKIFEIQNQILNQSELYLKEEILPINEDNKKKMLETLKKTKEFQNNKQNLFLDDLHYIITRFWFLVRKWILDEFSFSEKKIYTYNEVNYVYFKEEQKKEIETRLKENEKMRKNYEKTLSILLGKNNKK